MAPADAAGASHGKHPMHAGAWPSCALVRGQQKQTLALPLGLALRTLTWSAIVALIFCTGVVGSIQWSLKASSQVFTWSCIVEV
jgi:hypothetical protein